MSIVAILQSKKEGNMEILHQFLAPVLSRIAEIYGFDFSQGGGRVVLLLSVCFRGLVTWFVSPPERSRHAYGHLNIFVGPIDAGINKMFLLLRLPWHSIMLDNINLH